MRRWTDGKS